MTVQPVTTTQNLTADRSWLASLHVTRNVDSITLDLSTFVSGTHYMPPVDTNVPYSRLLSGLPVGKTTASGLHGLYAPGAADGRRNLAGFIPVRRGSVAAPDLVTRAARRAGKALAGVAAWSH
ncbi:head decoration protein [Streptomyces sp. NPDC058691]|uniref:head decoration protein n=1 Tax=Streptomyces sp. NPDC058691 TaxID=3346601 RepID=UPI00364D95EA